ncbi:MAG: RagB/SusD family nutrient uptake outer membrane protein [Bacteroidales bacterium]|nr:RagB/SusD family nutrient uptake outer membrane protein [Bacteroidales bacterium]
MKNILKISLILLMAFAVAGCEDYLNPVPETQLDASLAFETKERIVGQVNGLYAFMKSGAFLGGRYFVYNDIRADNFIPKSTNLVTGYATWNHSLLGSRDEVQNLWGAIYSAINAINIFIEGLDQNKTDGNLEGLITDAEYNQYKSEALTLRAMCYFDLLQLYAQPYNKDNGASPGMPLRLTANIIGGNNDLARSTVAQTYTQILKDLNDAEPLAAATYANALLRTTRIHKNTIIAFKTRVYLHMNNWAAVKTEAAKIVPAAAPYVAPTGAPLALSSTFAAIWASPYTTAESILSMPFTATNLAGTQNSLAHYNHPSSSESYYLNVTGEAFLALNAADARRVLFQTGTVSGVTRYFVGKWQSYTVQSDYAPVLRYAEVLLNYAEALVKDGNVVTQQAVDLLNAVRTRSYPAGAYTLASFADAAAFNAAVMLERNIEFLGEGHRNMDLLRTMSTIPSKGGLPTVPPTSASYIWPIPDSEISTNKLMTGNGN